MMRVSTVLFMTSLVIGAGLFSGGALAQGAPLFAVMNGGNECDNASPPNCQQGDPDGFGSVTLIFPSGTEVCFGITVDNIGAPTLAHIHPGVSTENGPPAVTLVEPNTGNPGASSGCVAAPAATVRAIRRDPTRFYVNVHNGAFPDGAVRGQLH
jgi:hypothetical protein